MAKANRQTGRVLRPTGKGPRPKRKPVQTSAIPLSERRVLHLAESSHANLHDASTVSLATALYKFFRLLVESVQRAKAEYGLRTDAECGRDLGLGRPARGKRPANAPYTPQAIANMRSAVKAAIKEYGPGGFEKPDKPIDPETAEAWRIAARGNQNASERKNRREADPHAWRKAVKTALTTAIKRGTSVETIEEFIAAVLADVQREIANKTASVRAAKEEAEAKASEASTAEATRKLDKVVKNVKAKAKADGSAAKLARSRIKTQIQSDRTAREKLAAASTNGQSVLV